jgi:hypothetical protein
VGRRRRYRPYFENYTVDASILDTRNKSEPKPFEVRVCGVALMSS